MEFVKEYRHTEIISPSRYLRDPERSMKRARMVASQGVANMLLEEGYLERGHMVKYFWRDRLDEVGNTHVRLMAIIYSASSIPKDDREAEKLKLFRMYLAEGANVEEAVAHANYDMDNRDVMLWEFDKAVVERPPIEGVFSGVLDAFIPKESKREDFKGKVRGSVFDGYECEELLAGNFDLKPHVKASAIKIYMVEDGLTEVEATAKADELLSTNEAKVQWLKDNLYFKDNVFGFVVSPKSK